MDWWWRLFKVPVPDPPPPTPLPPPLPVEADSFPGGVDVRNSSRLAGIVGESRLSSVDVDVDVDVGV